MLTVSYFSLLLFIPFWFSLLIFSLPLLFLLGDEEESGMLHEENGKVEGCCRVDEEKLAGT